MAFSSKDGQWGSLSRTAFGPPSIASFSALIKSRKDDFVSEAGQATLEHARTKNWKNPLREDNISPHGRQVGQRMIINSLRRCGEIVLGKLGLLPSLLPLKKAYFGGAADDFLK